MDTKNLLIVIFGILILVLSLIWRYRIRKSKMQDPDFDRNEEAIKKEERINPDA